MKQVLTRIENVFRQVVGGPNSIMATSRSARNADGITNYYATYHYSDFKFNEDNIDAGAMAIPVGYHPPKTGKGKSPTLSLDIMRILKRR